MHLQMQIIRLTQDQVKMKKWGGNKAMRSSWKNIREGGFKRLLNIKGSCHLTFLCDYQQKRHQKQYPPPLFCIIIYLSGNGNQFSGFQKLKQLAYVSIICLGFLYNLCEHKDLLSYNLYKFVSQKKSVNVRDRVLFIQAKCSYALKNPGTMAGRDANFKKRGKTKKYCLALNSHP